ncbi:MAG: hypothetical protein JWM95_2636 [Gemmatimonadetes bacterium]|nr:hypothetical protein [Gemmatimonadota bacterium]
MPQSHELPAGWIDVVGTGRMGRALAAALREAGLAARGPFGRGATAIDASVVILCVPDREISAASAVVTSGATVGHVSASAPLDLLAPHERFSMHPLLTVVGEGAMFAGALCALEGSSDRSLSMARAIAVALGMRPREISGAQRALYHAAASAASNYVTTVLGAAERLAREVGVNRMDLEPLVRAAVSNWVELGAGAALTGPIVRGDDVTVARQRDAVATAAPETIPFWDALVKETRQLANLRKS